MASRKPKPQTSQSPARINPRLIFYTLIFALFTYIVVSRFSEISGGFKALGDAQLSWIFAAIVATTLTYFAAATAYVLLAKVHLSFVKTLGVQAAASFANRLIPSGVGGLGLNADYLIKNDHKATQASSVMALNSSLAFISSFILTTAAVLLNGGSLQRLFEGKAVSLWLVMLGMGLLIVAAVGLYLFESLRSKIAKFLAETWRNIKDYRHKKASVVLAIISATLVTTFYVFALYASAHAIGLSVSVAQTFIVYTIGTLIGAAVPTPGGIGGVEAGLYGGLIAFGYDASLSLSAVIIYRLITYWLPILPGYLSFWLLQRNKVI